MCRRISLAAALFIFGTSAFAQQHLSPESFVQQIEVNTAKLDGWEKIYSKEHGFRKIRVYGPTAKSIDVVRSESVLRPYVGKLHFFVSFAHGESFETHEQAETSASYSGSGSVITHECFIDFSPNKTAWEVTKLRCRSTSSPQFMELDSAIIAGSPLGDVVQALESVRAVPGTDRKPKKKAT